MPCAYLLVTYCTGIGEVYWLGPAWSKKYAFSLAPSDLSIQRVPPIYDQYPGGLGEPNPHPAHLTINRSDWLAANTIERRLAVQGFIYALSTRGWTRPTAPPSILERDLARCRGSLPGQYTARRTRSHCGGPYNSVQKHSRGGVLRVFPNTGRGVDTHKLGAPGWAITLHYWDIGEWLRSTWEDPKHLYVLTRKILDRADGRLNTTEMIRHALRWFGGGLRILSPEATLVLLSQLKPGSTVYDHYPCPHRALACALAGMRYVVPHGPVTEPFEAACTLGFDSFLKLDWAYDV